MAGYPLLLDVHDRIVVVVGGGAVALRRGRGLLEAGARVRVVAPEIAEELAELDVALERRPFKPADLVDAWLVVACTDDPRVNAQVAALALGRRTFCVRADLAAGGTARTPAVLRHDAMTVAVNGGDDPRRARALRDAIAAALDAGELPTARLRPAQVAADTPAPGEAALDEVALDEVALDEVALGEVALGEVALVGGGPGDPELITVRGSRLLAAADVVVVDRLAPRGLLTALRPDVEIIDCGKSAHRHNLTQDEINAVLVDRARAGRRVVRLKGGDPFVFGRGGEEWLACVGAGVPVTVVPGLSSALAAPAAANIPLTHRGVAADFTVVSGHLDPGRSGEHGVDWPGLAANGGTLVILMAMDRLELIARALITHGRAPDTPAAVVHRASTAGQRVVRAPLADLASTAERAGVGAPAVVVIGEVVAVLDT